MSVLYFADERYLSHLAGPDHPEAPERLDAVQRGIQEAGIAEALVNMTPTEAPLEALLRVHTASYVAALKQFCATGGGNLDPDTGVVPASFEAAMLAAGAGLDAVAALDDGKASAAFCAVRPPGHHARPDRAMGFCLINNIAVTAAQIAARGERALIVDYDVHHGNGTQEMFWDDGQVAYVSLHQSPYYPGTGSADETGGMQARGTILNVPVPAGATGDVYLMAFDELIVPFAERFAPDWLLVSAGFDAHREDPLAQVALSAGDFGELTRRLHGLVADGRTIAFLEGGYSLAALANSAGAAIGALAGVDHTTEPVTSGGAGRDVVRRLAEHFAG